jgi:hypothetical protein
LARKKTVPQKQENKLSPSDQRNRREHFGRGELSIRPDRSVFVNCPLDEQYAPLFDAIIFAITCCGFLARSSLESGNVAEPRMERIARAVLSSKYSIHDLSRCRGEGSAGLARFNMPLELGIAMGRRILAGDDEHDWLILVPEEHEYFRYLSDMGGYDPKTHNGTVESIVPKIIHWLATRPDAVYVPKPVDVLRALPNFQERKRQLLVDWGGEAPWADLIRVARDCIPD